MCTRVFWSDNSVAKVVSRTMDWAVSDDPVLWAVPEGTRRAAGDGVWESRFGVVGLSMWDSGTTVSGLDVRPGSPVRSLNPRGPGLVGDVTARRTPAALTY